MNNYIAIRSSYFHLLSISRYLCNVPSTAAIHSFFSQLTPPSPRLSAIIHGVGDCEQIHHTLQPGSSRAEIHPGSHSASREDLRGPGGLLSRRLARRCREIRETIITPASDPIDRAEVPGVPVLFQNDRRRAHR